MVTKVETIENTVVEDLLAEFNEILRTTGRSQFDIAARCPPAQRKELRSLMNVAALAYHALAPEREALLDDTNSTLAS